LHALISDKKFFNFLDINGSQILNLKSPFIEKAILKSCSIKKIVVQTDEKEMGKRKILNFGHTFAHAYEATLGYSNKLNHGEAVILGIKTAAKFGLSHKILKSKEFDLIENHLNTLNLSNNVRKFFSIKDLNKILSFMKKDKKNNTNKINLVLLKGIGSPLYKLQFDSKNINLFLRKELIK
jgi:3-dehydroquinate synthase/shikimate kinase/3-dehydroquinate synthase